MADEAAQFKHLIEGMIGRALDAAAAQRGWDLGAQAQAAQLSSSGAGISDFAYEALEFSTGYDGTSTTVSFTFDLSTFAPDGTDILL